MEGGGGRGIEGSRYVVFALGVRLPATFPYFSTARGAFFVFGGRRVGGGGGEKEYGVKVTGLRWLYEKGKRAPLRLATSCDVTGFCVIARLAVASGISQLCGNLWTRDRKKEANAFFLFCLSFES